MMDTEQMLRQILVKLDKLETDVQGLKTDVQGLKTSNETIMAQTAGLTEFRTEVNQKLDLVVADIDFLKEKEYQNERDLFRLKKVVRLADW